MCSSPEQQIAAFGRAIEELASQTPAPGHSPQATADSAESSDILNRLAALWAELASLDPEVAKRLPTYEA